MSTRKERWRYYNYYCVDDTKRGMNHKTVRKITDWGKPTGTPEPLKGEMAIDKA